MKILNQKFSILEVSSKILKFIDANLNFHISNTYLIKYLNIHLLRKFKVKNDVLIVSAHRTPDRLFKFAENAHKNYSVICAGAGRAAHLAGKFELPKRDNRRGQNGHPQKQELANGAQGFSVQRARTGASQKDGVGHGEDKSGRCLREEDERRQKPQKGGAGAGGRRGAGSSKVGAGSPWAGPSTGRSSRWRGRGSRSRGWIAAGVT